jgi:two-component system OmpR family response regulator
MYKLLLVDDDIELTRLLSCYFEREGFIVIAENHPISALKRITQDNYDLIILDVMMPDIDGIETLKCIRQHHQTPILMLTAKGDDIDRIMGLELGADDYVPKPCTPRELVARVRAILRRTNNIEENKKRSKQPLSAGELTLNPEKREVYWKNQLLKLTDTEFNLLHILLKNKGYPVSKSELSLQALGRPLSRYDRHIDVHISSIRHKLGYLADGRSYIQTIRLVGYQLIWE